MSYLKTKNSRRKYTKEEREQVMALFLKEESPSKISMKTGVNVSTIYNWTKRKKKISIPKESQFPELRKGKDRESKDSPDSYPDQTLPPFRLISLRREPQSFSQGQGAIHFESPKGYRMWVPMDHPFAIDLFFKGDL